MKEKYYIGNSKAILGQHLYTADGESFITSYVLQGIESGYVVCIFRKGKWQILGKDGYEIFDTKQDAEAEIRDLKAGKHYYYKKIKEPLAVAKQVFVLEK